jgi:hypothetical protein
MKKQFILIVCIVFLHFLSNAQRLEHMLLEQWSIDSWQNKMDQTHTYSSDNQLEVNTIRYWNETQNAWMNHSKTSFHRNENGRVLRKEIDLWNAHANQWDLSQKTMYTYDLSGNATSIVTTIFQGGNWKNQQQEVSEYGAENQLTVKISQKWNEDASEWQNERRYTYEFSADQLKHYAIDYWNNALHNWENYKQVQYLFSSENELESRVDYSWLNQEWKVTTVQTYEYNIDLVVNEVTTQKYNEDTEMFEPSNHVHYRLNSYQKLEESLTQKWLEGQFVNSQRFTYNYSAQDEIVEYDGFRINQLELFPNPTARFITIRDLNNGQITIADERGRVVMQIENKEEESITLDVSSWETGTYFLNSSNGLIQKFVKK